MVRRVWTDMLLVPACACGRLSLAGVTMVEFIALAGA